MIKSLINIENTEVFGWKAAIRGMRNPKNSWPKSDSNFEENILGENDKKLALSLVKAGPVHGKFLRMIHVQVDITAPLYYWKEMDTYKVGTTANSCSTMHRLTHKPFEMSDFSHEHLMNAGIVELGHIVDELNRFREVYLYGGELCDKYGNWAHFEPKVKEVWWQMIQLLPSSYNQKRTWNANYETLANIYEYRRNHKLDEWHDFCKWIEGLPYSELITCRVDNVEE